MAASSYRRMLVWLSFALAGLLTIGPFTGCGREPLAETPTEQVAAAGDSAPERSQSAANGDSGDASNSHAPNDAHRRRDTTTANGSDPPNAPASSSGDNDASGEKHPPVKAAAGPAEADKQEEAILDKIFAHRESRAPALDGGVAWINAAGPIDLKELRGKFVVLDFWTFCCINCMHIIPELKQLERAYPNNLVVIGVHSAKFEAEQDSKNITEAVLRYEIEHPVVNDAHQTIWNRYEVQSWPTLVMIDPEGYVLFQNGGEIKAEMLGNVLKKLISYYRKKGLLNETPLHFDLERSRATQTPLRYPGKIVADEPGNRLFISDSNHNRIVVTRLDGQLLDTIGSGEVGKADGDYKTAQFNRPQGMALADSTLYVADTENHLLRKIDLNRKRVATIAGTGRQADNGWPGWTPADRLPFDIGGEAKSPPRFVGPPRTTGLSSPWDLAINNKHLFIAMAGTHQIWKMPLDESEIGPYAGNSREDIVDGPLLPPQPYAGGFASFAQPSGLASDGKSLYVADSEGSSIRAVPLASGEVRTVVGTSGLRNSRLFTFGDVDGQGGKVRLQHPLGVAFHDGSIYVADTYNNKIKVIEPARGICKGLVGSGQPGRDDSAADAGAATLNEPSGLCYAAGKLYVADTNNHLIRTIDLEHNLQVATLQIQGLTPPAPPKVAAESKPSFKGAQEVNLPEATVKPIGGAIHLAVKFTLPEGYKMNPLAPMRYYLEAQGPAGPVDRDSLGKLQPLDHPVAEFDIKVPIKQPAGRDTLKLSMNYYYCQEGAEGLCKIGSVVWTVPIVLSGDGATAMVAVALTVEK